MSVLWTILNVLQHAIALFGYLKTGVLNFEVVFPIVAPNSHFIGLDNQTTTASII